MSGVLLATFGVEGLGDDLVSWLSWCLVFYSVKRAHDMLSIPQNLQTNFSIGIIPSPFFLVWDWWGTHIIISKIGNFREAGLQTHHCVYIKKEE